MVATVVANTSSARVSRGIFQLFISVSYRVFDLRKSSTYTEIVIKPDSIRTSLDIPAPLHRKLHEAAVRRGCSARQLILRSIERLVEEELPHPPRRAQLPLVRAAGRRIRPVTNDEALFS
jgi:hypothetical protein